MPGTPVLGTSIQPLTLGAPGASHLGTRDSTGHRVPHPFHGFIVKWVGDHEPSPGPSPAILETSSIGTADFNSETQRIALRLAIDEPPNLLPNHRGRQHNAPRLVMALNVIFDVLRINPFYTMLDTWSNLALSPFFLIGAFFGIGVTVLWLGMMLDCAFASKLPVWSKALWLLLLIPTISIGALIYYFCVYRKRPSQSSLPKDQRIPT